MLLLHHGVVSRGLKTRRNRLLISSAARLLSSSNDSLLRKHPAILGPLAVYRERVALGQLVEDPHQVAALRELDSLFRELVASGYRPPKLGQSSAEASAQAASHAAQRSRGSEGLASALGGLARTFGLAVGGGSENPSGAGGVKVSTFGAPKPQTGVAPAAATSSWWPFGSSRSEETGSSSVGGAVEERVQPPPGCPKGLYLHGGVGTGKTYTMDLFFDCVPVEHKAILFFQ